MDSLISPPKGDWNNVRVRGLRDGFARRDLRYVCNPAHGCGRERGAGPVSHVTEAADSATRIVSIASMLCPFIQEIKFMSASTLLQTSAVETEFVQIPATQLNGSRVALGT